MHTTPGRPAGARILVPLTLTLALAACGGGGSDADHLEGLTARGEPSPVALQNKCRTLVDKKLAKGAASVTAATVVDATGSAPEYCVVQVKFRDTALRFEAKLPTSGWNRQLAFLGGGGFDGNIAQPTQPYHSASILSERYATMATNGGHDAPPGGLLEYFKAEFAYDPVQLVDFTNQSEHRSLPIGKELIRFFYAQDVQRAYFEGCSMGGHDAMIQAQRFPEDFDGIVARAPAGNIMGLFIQFNRIAKQVRNPAGQLNTAKQTLLANSVLQQCDGLDGLADGIIGKPSACSFDPQVLRCTGGADTGNDCLSDAQIATVSAVTSPVAMTNGAFGHTGYFFGGENQPKGWGEYIWPIPALGDSLQGLFSDGFIRSFVTRNPSFDTSTWDANAWAGDMDRVGALFSANNPDLSGMRSRGAKLLMWNGTTDTSVSPKDNARYYDSVVSRMGQAATDQVVEYFQAPGVGHCFGGVGPDQVDLLKALSTWVEQGTVPSAQNLVHRKLDAGGATTMTRPLCKYPAYPRYKGTGNVNDAANFSCSTQ